jgi:hypothetical protein
VAIPFIDEKASIARCVSPKGRYKKIGLQQALGVGFEAWSPTFLINVLGDLNATFNTRN